MELGKKIFLKMNLEKNNLNLEKNFFLLKFLPQIKIFVILMCINYSKLVAIKLGMRAEALPPLGKSSPSLGKHVSDL